MVRICSMFTAYGQEPYVYTEVGAVQVHVCMEYFSRFVESGRNVYGIYPVWVGIESRGKSVFFDMLEGWSFARRRRTISGSTVWAVSDHDDEGVGRVQVDDGDEHEGGKPVRPVRLLGPPAREPGARREILDIAPFAADSPAHFAGAWGAPRKEIKHAIRTALDCVPLPTRYMRDAVEKLAEESEAK